MYLSHKYVHTTFFLNSFGSSSHARQRYQFITQKKRHSGRHAREFPYNDSHTRRVEGVGKSNIESTAHIP